MSRHKILFFYSRVKDSWHTAAVLGFAASVGYGHAAFYIFGVIFEFWPNSPNYTFKDFSVKIFVSAVCSAMSCILWVFS